MTLEVYSDQDVKENAWARVLLLGPAKSGKTVAVLKSSPPPVFVINADGRDATMAAATLGAKFSAVNVRRIADWDSAVTMAAKLVKEELARTVVVDTLTFLQDTILDEVTAAGAEGWDKWTKSFAIIKEGFRRLMALDAHLIVNAHMSPSSEESPSGIVPAVGGALKTWLPGIMNDWVLLDVAAASGERSFLLGPQQYWNHSGRSVRRTCKIPADVGVMLKEFGIKP